MPRETHQAESLEKPPSEEAAYQKLGYYARRLRPSKLSEDDQNGVISALAVLADQRNTLPLVEGELLPGFIPTFVIGATSKRTRYTALLIRDESPARSELH